MVSIITEIGLNHFGSVNLAHQYVDILVKTKTDGISFQIREPEFYERPEKKHLFLLDEDYISLYNKVKAGGKKFGVAIADLNKVDFFESLGADFYKIIRNDMTNDLLVSKLLSTGKKVIVSTGLSTSKDIDNFVEKFNHNKNFVLNHTQLSYEEGDCNLKAIKHLRQKYDVPISFGSHCCNHNVLYMSLCFKPTDILFYVKRDGKIKYPDDKHAIQLKDVALVSKNIKNLSKAVGTGQKTKIGNKITEMKI